MGNKYWIERTGTPVNTTDDFLTVISGTGRRLRLLQAIAGGQGTSAPQALVIRRAPAGTTPGGPITPTPADHAEQPAANFTTATTWAVQPVPVTNGIKLVWNALGGMAQWTATQITKGVLEARNGEVLSFRPPAGVTPQAMSLSVLIEED